MTFLENLAPLLKAAEEYAKVIAETESQTSPRRAELLAAETKLHEAAIEYAKWGK